MSGSQRSESQGSESQNGRGMLFADGLAATFVLAYRLGSLVLITLGFSGTWIGNLTVLESYCLAFISAVPVALFFVWWCIHRSTQARKPGGVCAVPQVRVTYKLIFWTVAALVLISFGFPCIMPLFC